MKRQRGKDRITEEKRVDKKAGVFLPRVCIQDDPWTQGLIQETKKN